MRRLATESTWITIERLSERYGVPVVIDAAASLGSWDEKGRGFGSGSRHPVVYSMHATKTFATAEAGLIYCSDHEAIKTLRVMGNFGFGQPRTATMPGLNAKLSEIGALLALAKLHEVEQVVSHRESLAATYRAELSSWDFQQMRGRRHAYQFMPILLPERGAERKAEIIAALASKGVSVAAYFSPHLAGHPYFRETCVMTALPVSDRIARRILSLPMSDTMTVEDIKYVCASLRESVQP
jgi:dTDP-4-amino-4,6-dideoxygalactose transaminase